MELHKCGVWNGTSFAAMEADLGLTNVGDLVAHLRAQDAPRAAQRLLDSHAISAVDIARGAPSAPEPASSAPQLADMPKDADGLFSVALDAVRMVSDEASARAFASALEAAGVLALDAEWRPDTEQSNHRPSLLQVALSAPEGAAPDSSEPLTAAAAAAAAGPVWLLDLEALRGEAAALVDAALGHAFGALPVLGFGLQARRESRAWGVDASAMRDAFR